MGALANQSFVKMNGIGNEIVVVDLRARGGAIAPEEARAAAAPQGAPYDQLMALYPPRTPGTDAFIRIYNNDGSEAGACGNGMRCVADLVSKESGKTALTFETTAGILNCWKGADGHVHRGHGPAALQVERDSAGGGIPRHPRHRIADRADRQAGAAFAIGGEHGQSARDLLGRRRECLRSRTSSGRCWRTIRSFPSAPTSRWRTSSRATHIVIRTWERGAGLTKACGSAACAAAVAAARLKRTNRKVKVTLPGGELTIDWRESDDHVLMTGPVEFEFAGKFDPALFGKAGVA